MLHKLVYKKSTENHLFIYFGLLIAGIKIIINNYVK